MPSSYKNNVQSVADDDRRSVEIELYQFSIPCGTQIRWNLFLCFASATTVASSYSDLWRVHISAIQCPTAPSMLVVRH